MINPAQTYLTSKKYSYLTAKADVDQLEKNAERKVLKLFHDASHRIPAYQKFLTEFSIKPDLIKTIADFSQVPYTSKENYISKYSLEEKCWDGDISQTHMFAASSGSTGEPTFWPRQIEQEIDGAVIHEYLLEKVFTVDKKSTLFVNSFGLGNWIAGMFTQLCLYLNRLHGVPFTLANPGYNQEETFKVIKQFSKHFDQTIIACHPPILKMFIENGAKQHIDWQKLNIKFLGAGEGFSENWRDYLASLVSQEDIVRTIINIYGSADAGLMGFETPLSIALHRETSTNHTLNQVLFENERNPFLYQFDPSMRYLESIGGDISISMNATMPLIRYNIKDQGNIIRNEDMISMVKQQAPEVIRNLKQQHILLEDWALPFVYIFGRDRFMVTLYGVNIYPENIKSVVEHPDLQPFLTGRFSTEKKLDANQDQQLQIRLELKPGKRSSKTLTHRTQNIFVRTLKQLNSEYNQVEAKFGEKMHPNIKFHRFHHPEFFPEGKTSKMS